MTSQVIGVTFTTFDPLVQRRIFRLRARGQQRGEDVQDQRGGCDEEAEQMPGNRVKS